MPSYWPQTSQFSTQSVSVANALVGRDSLTNKGADAVMLCWAMEDGASQ